MSKIVSGFKVMMEIQAAEAPAAAQAAPCDVCEEAVFANLDPGVARAAQDAGPPGRGRPACAWLSKERGRGGLGMSEANRAVQNQDGTDRERKADGRRSAGDPRVGGSAL